MSSSTVTVRYFSALVFAMIAIQFLFARNILSLNQTSWMNQTNSYLHHTCTNSQGTYKLGSPYDENLNRVFRAISISISNYGFIQGSNGDAPNKVFAKLQCRGDSNLSKCRSCFTTAFSELRRRCPEKKGKIIWFDNCLLEISPINTLGKIDYQNNFYMYNAKDVNGDRNLFNKNTRALLNKLKEKATSEETNNGKQDILNKTEKKLKMKKLYAAGEESLGTMKLYAMVQCTKDLTIPNCNMCLNWIMEKLPKCCNDKQGGRVLSTSCNFRYELYPFVKT